MPRSGDRAVALALFLSAAFVGIATAPARAAEALPQACRVSIQLKMASAANICSGTLVAPDLVVTAAHCIPADASTISGLVDVGCGLRGMHADGSFAFIETRSARIARRNSAFTDKARVPREDFAFLRLDPPIRTITPLRVPDSYGGALERYTVPNPLVAGDLMLDPALECRIAGFGVPTGSTRPAYRTLDESPGRTGIRAYIGEDGMTLNTLGSTTEPPRRGDSGGPFFCRLPESDDWLLFAIVSETAGDDYRFSGFASTLSYSYRDLFNQVYGAPLPPAPRPSKKK